MALANYSDLKTAVGDWLARSDLSGNAADWITLAEAKLNRELNPVEEEATLTGTTSSRTIDVSSLSIVEPMALFITDTNSGDERELAKRDSFPYDSTVGEPTQWAYDATDAEINFDRPCDAAYSFRFQYRERFALSDSATTNWLLTNHPDVYLAASLVWGNLFQQKTELALPFVQVLERGIPEVRNIIAQQHRAVANIDPALLRVRMNSYYDGTYDL